ncbi:MAG: hypothetical protein HY459_01570 [Parcubacteria group bacterium]|nr:hypothetical protein [Parcubacteria group bacterium]
MSKTLSAIVVLSGTTIGVGIFGLPFAAKEAGLGLFLIEMAVLTFVAYVIHLMYGEVVIRTKGKHRFPGYVAQYLGGNAKPLALFTTLIGFYGAILAYLIVGGTFLAVIFSPIVGGSETLYTLIYFALGALLIIVGIRGIVITDLLFLIFFFVILILLLIAGWSHFNPSYLTGLTLSKFALPYGIILFSLWGASVIPEVRELLGRKERSFPWVLEVNFAIVIITYVLFTVAILGVSGPATSEEAIEGLVPFLGSGIVAVGALFGLATTFDSYITLGHQLARTYEIDYGLPKVVSLVVTLGIPIALYFLGVNQFLTIIGIAGAIGLGIDAVMIVLMHRVATRRSQPKIPFRIRLSPFIASLLILLFLGGIVAEVVSAMR